MIKYIPFEYCRGQLKEIEKDKRERFVIFTNAEVVFYKKENEQTLINDYDFMNTYIKDYSDNLTLNSYFERLLSDKEIELSKGLFVDIRECVELLQDCFYDLVWNDILLEGETTFNNWINATISDVATNQINNMIKALNKHDELYYNECL